MRQFHCLTLALAVATVALLAPVAQAQGVDSVNLLQGKWVPVTDPLVLTSSRSLSQRKR
jgi:hypothetical protein